MAPEKRQHIVDLYKMDTPEESQQMSKLLQGFNCILRVIRSWKRKIDVEKFSLYVKETHLRLHDLFPWLKDNETVHVFLGHIVWSI